MRYVALLLFFVLAACSTKEQAPEGLLDKDKFTAVLAGATLIEARMNYELTTEAVTNVPVMSYYDDLFEEEGVTREAFERTFDHYAARPLEMKAIYEEVVAILGRWKDEAAQRPVLERKADTLAADADTVKNS